MFERFGVMDIWYEFKKYRAIVLTIILGVLALLIGKNIISVKETVRSAYNVDKTYMYTASASYYVSPKISEDYDKADLSFYRSIPDDYAALLNTDFCHKYIYDGIISKFSKERIVNDSLLGRGTDPISPKDFNVESVKRLYQAKKYSGTMVINLVSGTYEEALSDEVLRLCQEFLVTQVDTKISDASIEYAGGAKQALSPNQVPLEDLNQSGKSVSQTTSAGTKFIAFFKSVVIPFLAVIILCVAALILIGVLNPTLNSKSDFCEYDVLVIGQIDNFHRFKEKY